MISRGHGSPAAFAIRLRSFQAGRKLIVSYTRRLPPPQPPCCGKYSWQTAAGSKQPARAFGSSAVRWFGGTEQSGQQTNGKAFKSSTVRGFGSSGESRGKQTTDKKLREGDVAALLTLFPGLPPQPVTHRPLLHPEATGATATSDRDSQNPQFGRRRNVAPYPAA